MWSQCCWSPERRDYYEGKHHAYNVRFHVAAEQQAEIQVRGHRAAPATSQRCRGSSKHRLPSSLGRNLTLRRRQRGACAARSAG
jgi:hypothetical protein